MEMDCIRTQATLSAVHDGEHVIDENAEAARAHCDECEQCRAFAADLKALDSLPAPQAPPELVGRVMVAVAAIAAERAEDERSLLPEARPVAQSDEPVRTGGFEWFTGRARWGAIAAAAAAVLLVAFLALRTPAPPTAGVSQTATSGSGSVDLTFSNKAGASTAPVAAAPTPAPARAPDYVTFKGRVYAPGSLLAASAASTQTVGTVTTAFAGAAAPAEIPAYRSPLTDGSIVLTGPDGSRLYEPVVRMYNSVKYQLVAGNSIERFGVWPQLPSRFPAPTSPNGSPTFTVGGGDGLGVPTYAAEGVPEAQGFAIAPGTPGTDPAASNPNWTWWEPIVIP